jgi:hypothetical protein
MYLSMADPEAELREQLTEALKDADYPVANQMDLVPALPNGPSTRFEADGVSFTAMELSTKLSGIRDFPYASAEDLVDDILDGLKTNGTI